VEGGVLVEFKHGARTPEEISDGEAESESEEFERLADKDWDKFVAKKAETDEAKRQAYLKATEMEAIGDVPPADESPSTPPYLPHPPLIQ
jgi:hypothetical protein